MIMELQQQPLFIQDFSMRWQIMKKFYINLVVFFAILIIALAGLDYLSMLEETRTFIAELTDSTDYFINNGSAEIKPYIARAQTQDGTTKLIIGDSVCRQMFLGLQEYNSDFTIIGSNGAITVAGQYILAKEYLDNHPEATDVFLILLPESLGRTFDTTYGYQYTVMPFAETNTLGELDKNTLDIMASVYGDVFLNPRVVTAIDLSGINRKLYLNLLRDNATGYTLSNYFEIADQYVVKISDLCKERGVNFHLYPCPVSEIKKEEIDSLEEAFAESEIYRLNPNYLNMVYYYSADQAADGTHFSGDYANQKCYNEKIMSIFVDRELLEMLKFQ